MLMWSFASSNSHICRYSTRWSKTELVVYDIFVKVLVKQTGLVLASLKVVYNKSMLSDIIMLFFTGLEQQEGLGPS